MLDKFSTPIRFLALLIAAVGLFVIWSVDLDSQNQSQVANDCSLPSLAQYAGEDDQTALALLERDNEVTKQSYDFGDLVTSINGQTPANDQFMLFCVNGQPSSVGASDYTTSSSDAITWHLAPIR